MKQSAGQRESGIYTDETDSLAEETLLMKGREVEIYRDETR